MRKLQIFPQRCRLSGKCICGSDELELGLWLGSVGRRHLHAPWTVFKGAGILRRFRRRRWINGTSLSHLQASGGWQGWGELPPSYNTCAYPCPGVTWSMTQGIKSPSLSGDAAKFNIGGTTSYADVLWNNHLIGQNSSQGLPDSNHTLLPTLHNFTYDAYFYPTNLGVTQALEFDINMYFDGLSLVWGHQCNVGGGNVWDVWDNVNSQWVSTGAACHPKNNAWNHLTIQVQRESDNWLLFQSITLNGVTSTINRYYAPGSVSGNWWGITVNYQMDGNHDQAAYSGYLDNFTFTYW